MGAISISGKRVNADCADFADYANEEDVRAIRSIGEIRVTKNLAKAGNLRKVG
jgi:hypothetical protein